MMTRALKSGLRMLLIRMCETMPVEGKIAMYTSGWPKNQNKCCQRSGDPPECGCKRSLTTKPEGMKKLVPAVRSRIKSMQAGRSTANASSAMHEVMNQAQVQIGMRMRVMPFARRSRVVEIKLSAPSKDPMQKMAIEIAQRFIPQPIPGPASLPTALKGAYEVQPEIGGPSGMTNARTNTRKATSVIQNDIILKRGKAISSAPIWIGRKKLPNAANGALVSTKNTISVPCMVSSER